MQIQISTRHGHLSDASQEKIRSKAEKLNRFFDRLTSIEVTIDVKDPEQPAVDLRVSAEHKHDFVARDTSADLMTSVDAAIHKIQQQLRKYKEKVQERHRNPEVRRQSTATESTEN